MTAKKRNPDAEYLDKTIDAIMTNQGAERDLYAYIRDLLTSPVLKLGWKRENIVIDSSIGSGIPDVMIFPNGPGGKPNKASYNAAVIFEGKTQNQVQQKSRAIFEDKKKYIQLATRWMVLFDQSMVKFIGIGSGQWEEEHDYSWSSLKDPETFVRAFGRVSSKAFDIKEELKLFKEGKTKYSWANVELLGTDKFLQIIRETSQLLREQITALISNRAVKDLKEARVEAEALKEKYGPYQFHQTGTGVRITFPEMKERTAGFADPADKIRFIYEYDRDIERYSIVTEPYQWTLKVEYVLLKEYAAKTGTVVTPSILSSTEDNRRIRESFIYETSSFILARMLLIRFSEDNGFMDRYVSNGGISDFITFAKRFSKGYQFLLKEAYKHAAELYRNLFDESSLDWILDVKDQSLNDVIEYSLYLLSEFDFKTVKGDILSGVYDGFLEKNKRKALGEYYTRPEIARYILDRCGYDTSKTVLDPAAGTGTFAVEALNMAIERLRSRGMLDTESISAILDRLNGLDINIFAIALAQVQFFWHLFELFQGKTKTEIRALAGTLIPSINLCGGQSSLETAGILFNGQDGFAFSEDTRIDSGQGPKWLKIMRQGYDICTGNPPWIRAHRMDLPEVLRKHYEDVYEKQVDISVLFLFKALRQWVKPDGYAGFILPYSTLESESGGKLREVIKKKTIVELIDMELVAPRVFDADTVPVILIIRNTPSGDDQQVRVTVLTDEAYNEVDNRIDFSKAHVYDMPLKDILTASYGNAPDRITPKIYPADVPVLQKIGRNKRLSEIARRLWVNKTDNSDILVATPGQSAPAGYRETTLVKEGLKLGGAAGFSAQGLEVFKASNVFPEKIMGPKMGQWDPKERKVQALNIYQYLEHMGNNVFATRKMSQVPVAVKCGTDLVFNNSAHVICLGTTFPLHIYLLSRIPQFFAFKTLRTEAMLRRRAVWNVAEIRNIPIPGEIDEQAVLDIGSRIFRHSNDLLNKYRHVEEAIKGSKTWTLRECVLDGRIPEDAVQFDSLSDDVKVRSDEVSFQDGRIVGGLFLDITVAENDLFDYLRYCISNNLNSEYIDKSMILGIAVPAENLPEITELIRTADANQPEEKYRQDIDTLDRIMGKALGLDDNDIDYVVTRFREDPFLKRISPNMPHLGMKFQAYRADYGRDGERYR